MTVCGGEGTEDENQQAVSEEMNCHRSGLL